MPDVDTGQGQGASSPEPTAAPGAPTVPPADAGQGDAGQGAGQGADGQHHDLDPAVSRAQQAAADARRENEALREQLAQAGQAAPQPSDADPDVEAFDKYAAKSRVIQNQTAVARNSQAQLMDTQMVVNKETYPHYDAVRPKVIADLKSMGDIPVERMPEAMAMIYARHASPIVNARDSALLTENATLKAQFAAMQGLPQNQGIDVGALHAQGGTAAQQQADIQEPSPDAPAAEWAIYIDAIRGL